MSDNRFLGVDVGGTRIKWITATGDGCIIHSGSRATPHGGPTSVMDLVSDILSEAGPNVSSIGVAVPGHVDVATGRTGLIPNVAGDWRDFPFAETMEQRHGLPTTVINDARAFGFAELAADSSGDSQNAIFATIGTGIGGAIAMNGAILRNANDSVGELGHTIVVRGGELCGCGGLGCAEAYAGVRGISRRYLHLTGRSMEVDQIRLAAQNGDRDAAGVIADAAWAVGCSISNLGVQLGISTVVLGGGLGTRWAEFAVETQRQLTDRQAFVGHSEVRTSLLGDIAGALGAGLAGRSKAAQNRDDNK